MLQHEPCIKERGPSGPVLRYFDRVGRKKSQIWGYLGAVKVREGVYMKHLLKTLNGNLSGHLTRVFGCWENVNHQAFMI